MTIGQVSKRLKDSSHKCCFTVALPCGVDSRDTEKQTVSLRNSFMNYFAEKKAAGSLVIKSDSTWLVYIFPPCKFVDEHLNEYAPDLKATTSDLPKLLIAIIPKVKIKFEFFFNFLAKFLTTLKIIFFLIFFLLF